MKGVGGMDRPMGKAGAKVGKMAIKKLSAPTTVFAKKPKKNEPDDMPGKLKGGPSPVKTPKNPTAAAKRLAGKKI